MLKGINMLEQKCIICGNIVRFNRGQKVATCEFCETKQEFDGVVEPIIEPVTNPIEKPINRTPLKPIGGSLERARKLDVAEIERQKEEMEKEESGLKAALVIGGIFIALAVLIAVFN